MVYYIAIQYIGYTVGSQYTHGTSIYGAADSRVSMSDSARQPATLPVVVLLVYTRQDQFYRIFLATFLSPSPRQDRSTVRVCSSSFILNVSPNALWIIRKISVA
jgi:hypothetical protein